MVCESNYSGWKVLPRAEGAGLLNSLAIRLSQEISPVLSREPFWAACMSIKVKIMRGKGAT